MNFMKKTVCSVCGKDITEENVHKVGEKTLCDECLESHTSCCACCGERIWTEEVIEDEYIIVC